MYMCLIKCKSTDVILEQFDLDNIQLWIHIRMTTGLVVTMWHI